MLVREECEIMEVGPIWPVANWGGLVTVGRRVTMVVMLPTRWWWVIGGGERCIMLGRGQ